MEQLIYIFITLYSVKLVIAASTTPEFNETLFINDTIRKVNFVKVLFSMPNILQ